MSAYTQIWIPVIAKVGGNIYTQAMICVPFPPGSVPVRDFVFYPDGSAQAEEFPIFSMLLFLLQRSKPVRRRRRKRPPAEWNPSRLTGATALGRELGRASDLGEGDARVVGAAEPGGESVSLLLDDVLRNKEKTYQSKRQLQPALRASGKLSHSLASWMPPYWSPQPLAGAPH